MLTFDGSNLLVEIIKDKNNYQIEGITKTKITLTNNYAEQTNYINSDWKESLEASGRSILKIELEGLYSNSIAEKFLIVSAFAKKIEKFNILFGNNDIISGNFFITNYSRIGNVNESEFYLLTLVSTSKMQYYFEQQTIIL